MPQLITGQNNVMQSLQDFRNFSGSLAEREELMPVLFIGHGSPMNGIEDNTFSNYWKMLGKQIPVPAAVIVVSAHWLTKGTRITAMDFPTTIHDFGGFPKELFDVQYPAPGHPGIAIQSQKLVQSTTVELDHEWGLDHGTWTIIRHMYPQANIPVLQLSIDYTKTPSFHYHLAGELYQLRKKGVLIIGSGNMVHNLRLLDWTKMNRTNYGFDWAVSMNEQFKKMIVEDSHDKLVHFDRLGVEARLSIPTPEHYLPLLYTLGLKGKNEQATIFNDQLVGGSLTMTSVQIGS
jgi:4,5-DOPA dioxygenase extradiol